MTLREAIGGDDERLRSLIDTLLDSEDALVVLFDGERTVSFVQGLGLSPCQSELLTTEIERLVRATGAGRRMRRRTQLRKAA